MSKGCLLYNLFLPHQVCLYESELLDLNTSSFLVPCSPVLRFNQVTLSSIYFSLTLAKPFCLINPKGFKFVPHA